MQSQEKPWLKSYPPEVPEFIDPRPFENLNDLFDYATAKYADNIAFVNMVGRITYAELARDAERFAAFLQHEWHLGKGDKLAIMLPNLIQFPVVLFGALKAGLTVTNVNPLYTPRELQAQLEKSEARAIVVIANFAFNLQSVLAQTKIEHIIVTSVGDNFGLIKGSLVNFTVRFIKKMVPSFLLPNTVNMRQALRIGTRHVAEFKPVEIHYDDIAFLQFTGGTTGRSKGAMLSHGNVMANMCQGLGMYGHILRPGRETILTAIPLYHVFAMTVNLMIFVYIGGKNLLITDPRNFKSFLNDLKHHPEVSCMTGVNTLFNALVNHNIFERFNLRDLRLVIGGGAAVQSGVEARFFKATGLHILEGYGLTECSPLCCVNPPNIDRYLGSIGLPVPSCVARIIDIEGREINELGVPGELEFKGPQVMKGYYKNDKATRFVMDGEFIRTGDIAEWMEGGYIKLIDRLKDMILVSGFNVFPNEIEDVVSKNDRVIECAAVGVHSEKTGEADKL